jgi:hypothetical protein
MLFFNIYFILKIIKFNISILKSLFGVFFNFLKYGKMQTTFGLIFSHFNYYFYIP